MKLPELKTMKELYWCYECKVLFETGTKHKEHRVAELTGDDEADIITSLDELIQYALDTLEEREKEQVSAEKVKEETGKIRQAYLDTSEARIKRVCEDVRVAMDELYGSMLFDINTLFEENEFKVKISTTTFVSQKDLLNRFVAQAAQVIPDKHGKVDPTELKTLFNYFSTVKNIADQPAPEYEKFEINIPLPNSLEERKAIKALAKSMCGEIDDPKRESFLHYDGEGPPPDPEEGEDVPDIVKPIKKILRRKITQDMLKY